jgi:hypothetical protein
MQVKTFSATANKFKALQDFAVIVQTADDKLTIVRALEGLKNSPLFASKGWQVNFAKLLNVIYSDCPEFKVFAAGNSKLGDHIAAFSTLPGVTCPGAGECLSFCYSYSAWRYPAAFARQAQNAYLMRFAKPAIVRAFVAIPDNATLRLYVDGDFASIADIDHWQSLLATRPDIKAYGYSKSFDLLLTYNASGKAWASNYLLNISGGHNASQVTAALAQALPIARGTFEAVSIGRKVKSSEHGLKSTNKALREAYGKNAFTCPGKCSDCTPNGHACGLPSFQNVPIIIAVH